MTSDPRAGDVVAGRYELVRELGAGAMGRVFEARHTGTGRRVALKVVAREIARHARSLARFEREARATGSIDSEHVVQVLDVGVVSEGGPPFLAMELLVGEDLERTLARLRPLSPDAVTRIAIQACLGLEKAHEGGVLHRDIKPANLFLAERDGGELRLKLVDFGLAKTLAPDGAPEAHKLTRTGTLLGSPLYMSPEQVLAKPNLDARSDLFSLGVVLFEALAGEAPLARAEAMTELLVSIATLPAPPLHAVAPWVPEALAAVVDRALALDPAARWPSARAMREALVPLAPEGWVLRSAALTRGGTGLDVRHSASVVLGRTEASVSAVPTAHTVAEGPSGAARTAGSLTPGAAGHTLAGGAAHTIVADGSALPVEPGGAGAPNAPTPAPSRVAAQASRTRGLTVVGGSLVAALALAGAGWLARGPRSPSKPAATELEPERSPSLAPSAPMVTAAPRPEDRAGVALAGAWESISTKRVYDAVVTDRGVELRVRDASRFASQGYEAGEARFTLVPRAGGEFDVLDHLRPEAPGQAAYGAAGKAACLRTFTEAQGKPLRARIEGDKLTVQVALLRYEPRTQGGEVVSCPGLDRATATLGTSALRRLAAAP